MLSSLAGSELTSAGKTLGRARPARRCALVSERRNAKRGSPSWRAGGGDKCFQRLSFRNAKEEKKRSGGGGEERREGRG